MEECTKPLSIYSEICAGFSAGIVGTILGFPLDTLKTRMQTSSTIGEKITIIRITIIRITKNNYTITTTTSGYFITKKQ